MNKSQLNFKPLPWLMAPVLSIFLVACGGGGQDTILGTGGVVPVIPSAPTVTLVNPTDASTDVATNTTVKATFSEAMDLATINNNFTLSSSTGQIDGTVSVNARNTVATFTPSAKLKTDTKYTATVSTGATDLAGNPLANSKVWTFTTGLTDAPTLPSAIPLVDLKMAEPFGSFGGTAGMTNTGIDTEVNGDIGTIATGTSSITGFYENIAYGDDVYSGAIGEVNGVIYTCTTSTTGANSVVPSAPECDMASQARLDAEAAYLALKGVPAGSDSGAGNLANLSLTPGTYTATSGSFMILGGDLTLDAQGDANATWVFQMATTLTVGDAAVARNIILKNGALAKNVFWQVGTAATINAAGGGTMVGTIITKDGVTFSTAGNTNIVTLNGRALSLGASVTMVNTVINVPAQ